MIGAGGLPPKPGRAGLARRDAQVQARVRSPAARPRGIDSCIGEKSRPDRRKPGTSEKERWSCGAVYASLAIRELQRLGSCWIPDISATLRGRHRPQMS
jgi:hypothetical protein